MTISRSRRSRAFLIALPLSLALVAGAYAAGGQLTQKAGTAGCLSETGSSGACINARALLDVQSIVVSPDGKSVYTAAADDNTTGSGKLGVFDRDPATGILTQKANTAGCISSLTSDGCATGSRLANVPSVAVSPDGAHVYTTATGAGGGTSIYDRASDGALTQRSAFLARDGESIMVSPDGKNVYITSGGAIFAVKRETDGSLTEIGCRSDAGGICVNNGGPMAGVKSVVISPDGNHLYAAAQDSDAVVVFNRTPADGHFFEKAAPGACVSSTGSGGACDDGKALGGAQSVAISPDGKNVYVASSETAIFGGDGGLAIFDRNASTGILTQKAGRSGCYSSSGTEGECMEATGGMNGPASVAVSDDGKSVYVASAFTNSVEIFDRDPSTGALTQKGGTEACISNNGSRGACVDGTELQNPRSIAIAPGNANAPGGANVYTANLDSDSIAVFDRAVPVALTVERSGEGRVFSSPTGIDCGNSCVTEYGRGAQVTLTASPLEEGHTPRFSGGGCPTAANTSSCTVTMDASKTVQVFFDAPTGSTPPPVGNPPGGGGQSDTTAPKVTVKIDEETRAKRAIKVLASVDEAASAFAFAKVKGEPIELDGSAKDLAAGERGRFKVKFSKKDLNEVKQSLKNGNDLKLKVAVAATDAAGNTATGRAATKLTLGGD